MVPLAFATALALTVTLDTTMLAGSMLFSASVSLLNTFRVCDVPAVTLNASLAATGGVLATMVTLTVALFEVAGVAALSLNV